MSELFFTDPDSAHLRKRPPRVNIHLKHKERTVTELVDLGVSQQIAELAVIDLRHILHVCQVNKMTPNRTANFMYGEVCSIYSREDGRWHYSD